MKNRDYWWKIAPNEGKYFMAKLWNQRRILAKCFCYFIFNKDDII